MNNKFKETVWVDTVLDEAGELIGFEGNLNIGDVVYITKYPIFQLGSVSVKCDKDEKKEPKALIGKVIRETPWIYQVSVDRIKEDEVIKTYAKPITIGINKYSLYAKKDEYITVIVQKEV